MTVVTIILCFRISRATPSELISWSTFINGLGPDMKNDFVWHFPQFQSEQSLIYLSETAPLSESPIVNGIGADTNGNGNGGTCVAFTIYPESLVMSQITKYLNRLDLMGFRIISSTVDNSSVETNCIKKCYTWTLQTMPAIGS